MFGFLKSDPRKKLEEKRKKLLTEAMHVQRSGDLKLYAVKMEAIDKLEKELDALQSAKSWKAHHKKYFSVLVQARSTFAR